MASAVDIITYVGIPLAVLGVLPTIYTAWKSFLTLRQITRMLYSNGVTAITRSALLSGIVEVEIPRQSITPLHRGDPKYFGLREKPSRLKGGTWTLFEWKEMVIGVKSYRLQYHDELVQPQAEIDFEALIAFLLDRGAVPSQAGWADLRGAGLWTVAGTRLLVSPDSDEEVLSVALSDDSDGILSLSLNWKPEWEGRGRDSLPPYWVKIKTPNGDDDLLARVNEIEEASKADGTTEKRNGAFLDDASAISEDLKRRTSTRIRISATGIQEAYRVEDAKHELRIQHLLPAPPSASPASTAGFWFCCAATALQAPQGGLWSFTIPPDILALARHSTVPCGVMVLLETMTDDEVPAWRTPYDDQAERLERQVKAQNQSRVMMEEARLPPAQRDAARKSRMEREAMDFHNDHRRRILMLQQRREAETLEAIQSQRLPIGLVAGANLKFLKHRLRLGVVPSLSTVVEHILHGMLQDSSFARRLSVMLDLWKSWAQSGGMTKSHYLAVKEDQVTFALASCLLAILRDMVSEPSGSVVGDLQECLRIWKKVRLG
ncbi:hypothetical protein BU23DRAFT_555195 [Bimuria novae-zelandiae CBS 107.79]|uniref:Uncharacterized protein n=1 Tax=Bimuria novae-zelandiae CBS 107.79 TaxID=1447943 RepID=A0A6A5V6A9_9PLEO|nr:hypothetical protein BU23DRAFT_555195 [Bimuria novae-zelandiae CBS 107.79]